MNVGIYIYDEVEVLDLSGPFEVFFTASRVKERMDPDHPPLFNVFTIAENETPILARGGLKIVPAHTISDHPAIDILIIPGGIVSRELQKEYLISWIRESAVTAEITGSVCTGAFLLAKAGLLRSKTATTHWEDISDLRSMFQDVKVISDVRWVDEGDVITSAGITAGIDMSLHLVSRLDSKHLAVRTAKQMEFDWTQNT